MNRSNSKTALFWGLLVAGTCGVLVIFSCGLASLFGAGGLLLLSDQRDSSSPSTHKPSPRLAQLEEIHGWVEILEGSGEWTPAVEGQDLAPGQIIRTEELSGAVISFYDGSWVALKSNSELSIDELNAQKYGRKRTILLTQRHGESEHHVAPNENSSSTYNVRTPSGEGEAKGTVFQVIVTPDQLAHYYVLEGSVEVTSLDVTVTVHPGEVTTVHLNQPPSIPVIAITAQGILSLSGGVWSIAGQDFIVSEETEFFGSPASGDLVLVRGRLLGNEHQAADSITLLQPSSANRFSISGSVDMQGDEEWLLNGQAVRISATTLIDEGITTGDLVRAAGYIAADGSLQAERIERLVGDLGFPFNITGVIQSMEDSLWIISGLEIWVDEDTTIESNFQPGDVVQVRGWILDDGEWLARSILQLEQVENDFVFTGTLESMDPWIVSGREFEVREWTEIDEELANGDLIHVEGIIDADGAWVAVNIERIDLENTLLILVGTVISADPWVISGIPLALTPETVITGKISPGMLVRVEIVPGPGGWQVVKLQPLAQLAWFPGCIEVVATVVSTGDGQIQLQGWPALPFDDLEVDGRLTPNSVTRITLCFDQDMNPKITYLLILEQAEVVLPEPVITPEESPGGKVTICHKPGKKNGGNTLTIGRPALPAHLAHGDYTGPCR